MLVFSLLALVALIAVYAWYKFAYEPYQVFKRYNIPGPTPKVFFGSYKELARFREGPFGLEAYRSLIDKYGPVCGFYFGYRAVVVIADPELVKTILVKEFSRFRNRQFLKVLRFCRDVNVDVLLGAQDDDWKHLRQILNPVFSSKKLRMVEPTVKRSASRLLHKLAASSCGDKSVDVLPLCKNFLLEINIASFFGKAINLLGEREDEDTGAVKFAQDASTIFQFLKPSEIAMPAIYASAFPWLMRFVPMMIDRSPAGQAMLRIIDTSAKLITDRKASGVKHQDFLQLIIDADEKMTVDEIVAQATNFLLGGVDTTMHTLAFALYQLAMNPEVQGKLDKEISDHFEQNTDTSLYDALTDLEYLDMVVNETLRMYPAFTRSTRFIATNTKLGEYTIPAGTIIEIPIYYLHYNPEWWPEPQTFDPDRFLPEQKEKRPPCSFIPFGEGPRNCIGYRYALMVLKMALVEILLKFTVETTVDTQFPLKTVAGVNLMAVDPIQLKFTARDE